MPGRERSIVLNLPGDEIGDVVVGILRPLGCSAIELARAKTTAKRVFNDRLYDNLRRLVVPAVQKRLPVRTGRLKRSFGMTRRGDAAIFSVEFYGLQKVVRPRPRVTVRALIVEEFARRANPVIGNAIQAALDAV